MSLKDICAYRLPACLYSVHCFCLSRGNSDHQCKHYRSSYLQYTVAKQLLSVERLELCPSGKLPPVCLYFFSLSVVMWLRDPLPEIPGNPRASWDITKLALFLRLCLFHWRLHYVSLSDFCRPGSSVAHSPWELKVILFSGWLTHIIAFKTPEFLTFNACANSRPQTI